jgi:UDP-N-acetylmuramate--alanine ligase
MFATCTDDQLVIHFIGLGGIGMSGLAEILQALGYTIQGSDKCGSPNIERLKKLGITTFIGHSEKNVEKANVVVYSSAIMRDNIELKRARELKIPCLSRSEMLSQTVRFKKSVVIAGSHGKTTVTSLCAAILDRAGISPTIVNGGIINACNTNARLGAGEWCVVESDESDGSFTQFTPTIGIITNVDREHILHYGSFDLLKSAFLAFLNNIPFYGIGIVCVDDPNVVDVVSAVTERKIITYGINNQDAAFRAINIKRNSMGSVFDIALPDQIIEDVTMPLLGEHNIRNALAAIAMAIALKIDINTIKAALSAFSGVRRRFTQVGRIGVATVIDDYAHHPTEIKALLQAARQRSGGKVLIICQPHRFTRLNTLFREFCECFVTADEVVILPVYVVSDTYAAKLTSEDLFNELKKKQPLVYFMKTQNELEAFLKNKKKDGLFQKDDIVLFAGAGDISNWAYEIVANIGELQ